MQHLNTAEKIRYNLSLNQNALNTLLMRYKFKKEVLPSPPGRHHRTVPASKIYSKKSLQKNRQKNELKVHLMTEMKRYVASSSSSPYKHDSLDVKPSTPLAGASSQKEKIYNNASNRSIYWWCMIFGSFLSLIGTCWSSFSFASVSLTLSIIYCFVHLSMVQ